MDYKKLYEQTLDEKKVLKKENEELKKEIRHLEDRAIADYDCHMNQYKELKKKLLILEEYTGPIDTKIMY